MHIVLVFLGATLALIAYLVVLNVRTLGVDARGRCIGKGCHAPVPYKPACGVSFVSPFTVAGSYFKTSAATGSVYRDGTKTKVGSFQISTFKVGSYYFLNTTEIPSNVYTSPGTYRVKVNTTDCGGSFNI